MYLPTVFAEESPDEIRRHIAAAPFATVVTTRDGSLFASHLPMLIKQPAGPELTLYGHLARANRQCLSFDGMVEALFIFHGPHAYISPTIYGPGEATPTWEYTGTGPDGTVETQVSPALPTWNYAAVHVYGRPRTVSPEENERALGAMTRTFEDAWSMADLPDDYIRRKVGNTVGFEVVATRIEAKVKMGQRQSSAGRALVSAALHGSGDPGAVAVAREIDRFRNSATGRETGCPRNE